MTFGKRKKKDLAMEEKPVKPITLVEVSLPNNLEMTEVTEERIEVDRASREVQEAQEVHIVPVPAVPEKKRPGRPRIHYRPPRPPLPEGWIQKKGEFGLLYTYDETGKPVCGAWRPKRHKYCEAPLAHGRNRCWMHGGQSLRGIASPAYQGKGKSRDMPAILADRYRDAMQDNDLLSMRSDIALLEARLRQQLQALEKGDMGELWIKAKKTYRELFSALRRGDDTASKSLLAELGSMLERGQSEYMSWRDILRTEEVKRKLSESERKRLVDLQQMISTEDLMLVMGAMVDSVRRNVTDEVALSNISSDLRKILQDKGLSPRG